MTVIEHGIFNLEISDHRACMDFNPVEDRYPVDLIDSSFLRECRFLSKLKNYHWSPKNVDIDSSNRKIYFDWPGQTCDEYLPENYAIQLEQIAKDLHEEKIYKPSFYPKYFYTDKEEKLYAYAFYSSSEYEEQPIKMDFYRPILNPERKKLVEQIEIDGCLDMAILIRHAFEDYIKWPGNPLPEIYRKVYSKDQL